MYLYFKEVLINLDIYEESIFNAYICNARFLHDNTFPSSFILKNNSYLIIVPYITDESSLLKNIHEYLHLYDYINDNGLVYSDDYYEARASLYEKKYLIKKMVSIILKQKK